MQTEAIVFADRGEVTFQTVEVCDPQPGDAVVRTLATLVSTGTDTRTLRGKQTGGQFPLVPGYSAVGVVEEALGDSDHLTPGDVVWSGSPRELIGIRSCWGAQVGVCVREADSFQLLDGRRPAAEYAFTKVAAIALHGVRRSAARPNDPVAIVGQGLIGQLHARIQVLMGKDVIVSDVLPWRLERSEEGGVARTVNATEEDLSEVVRQCWPQGVPVAVEASARQEGLDQCIGLLRQPAWGSDEPMPVLVIQSSFPGAIEFDYGEIFSKEVLIVPSRDCVRRDMRAAARMIGDGILRVDDLVTMRRSPEEAPEAFEELLNHPERHFTCVFEWD
ncbi:MAG: hypothetical protein R6V05_04495 [Candidatus Brocadiia bacterium]